MKELKQYITESNQELFTREYLVESYEQIMEKLITVGGKAYPNFGNVVIMAGGAGSGKGFVQSTLLGVEGKTFDVDGLKELAMASDKLVEIIKRDYKGVDISKFDLRQPADVKKLHEIIGDKLGLPKKQISNLLQMGNFDKSSERKPNLIFDVTMKNIDKLEDISKNVTRMGYDKKNIHIVWVVNDIKVSIEQNIGRDRVVPKDILMNTHKGAAVTMASLINGSVDVSKYMDGDIWLAFNQKGVDSTVIMGKGDNTPNSQTPIQPMKRGTTTRSEAPRPMTIKDANIVLIKKSGQRISKADITFLLIRNILQYVPEETLKMGDFR